MKKTKFITLLLIFSSFYLFSQDDYKPIQTGPRITFSGVNYGKDTMLLQGINPLQTYVDSLIIQPQKSDFTYGLGMFMQLNIKEYLYIRPEFLVNISNRHFTTSDIINNNETKLKTRLFMMEIPLNIGYRVEGVSIQAGLTWFRNLRANNPEGFNYEYHRGHTAYSFGLGYQKEFFLIDFYYQKSFSNQTDFYNNDDNLEYNLSTQPSYIGLKIGFVISGN